MKELSTDIADAIDDCMDEMDDIEEVEENIAHVMISYQWDYQEIMIKVTKSILTGLAEE